MLIPLGTDRGVRRTPVVTAMLVAVTVIAYAVMYAIERADPQTHARVLHMFWVVGGEGFRWWQPLTSTLLHGGLLHLVGNMVFLWVFGAPVEDRYGRLGFLGLYVLGAYAAGGLHAVFERQWVEPMMSLTPEQIRAYADAHGLSPEAAREIMDAATRGAGRWFYIPAVGASGAIAAVTGAFLVLFPRTTVRCWWIFSIVSVPAWWLIGLAIAWNLLSQSLGIDRGIAYLAHLGGYALGFGVSMVLLALRVFPREPYDLFTIFRQAHRRRQFKAAGASGASRPEAAAARRQDDAAAHAIEELAERRARVSTLLNEDREAEAVEAYRELVSAYAHKPGATTLSRSAQYQMAAYLFREGRHEEAAVAFERFLDAYPGDREADSIRVLLGRTLGEHLGRVDEAGEVLRTVIAEGADPDAKRLAREELGALGLAVPGGDDDDARE